MAAKSKKSQEKTIMILCVDRDNDLGRKAGIEGPVIGREANIEAAKTLALTDPEESDANTMFAAVKKFDELQKEFTKLEVVTLTGKGKLGYASDKKINAQLEQLDEKFDIGGFVLVTDGAEDEQVIPLLQSRARIISKQMVIIKQAKQVESAYYTIREALNDPSISRTVFGIPGIILTVYAITLALGAEAQFFQGIAFVLGTYLLLKGFGVETQLFRLGGRLAEGISVERVSFPFYMASGFVFLFGIYTGIVNFNPSIDIFTGVVTAVQTMYFFLVMAGLFIFLARTIDVVHAKRAYMLRKYIMYFVGTLMMWLIIDTATLVFLRQADLNFFLVNVLISFVILLLAFKATQVIDIRQKITQLLLDLPVYNEQGQWLGKIKKINPDKNQVQYRVGRKKDLVVVKKEEFFVKNGRIVLH